MGVPLAAKHCRITKTLMPQPPSPQATADAHFRDGCDHLAQGDVAAAETCFRNALALVPDFGEALTNLAYAMDHRGDVQAAEQTYLQALAAGADSAPLHLNLGAIYASQKRFEQAEDQYLQAIARNPGGAAAWSNLGALYLGQQRDDDAERALKTALALDPNHAKAQFNLSYLHLRHGRFEEGWRCYEARDWYDRYQRHFSIPRWAGEPLQHQSLVIVCEAGHGDAIQFCRYVPLAKDLGATAIALVCHPALKRLMGHLPGIDSVIGFDEPLARTGWDFWAPLMSLPYVLKTSVQTIPAAIPYLTAEPERVLHWRSVLPVGRMRVGLVWKGNPLFHNDADRSLPDVTTLIPLWQVHGVDFISLQKGAGEETCNRMNPDYPLLAIGPRMDSFADAAAIVCNLDLVICVDTAIAHLAGALGRACWVMLPWYMPDWRWGVASATTPWYAPNMRLFRQQKDAPWSDVVGEVARALALAKTSPTQY